MARILIAVDFSASGQSALTAGIGLAKDLQTDVLIVHAFEPNPNAPLMAGIGYAQMFDELAAEAETAEAIELTTKYAQQARDAGLNVDTEARPGKEADVILDAAEAPDVSFLVMGSRGHSGFKRFVLGSVAQEVIQRATKPVLVVPPQPSK